MKEPNNREVEALLAPWSGPYGGLPPFDRATPAAIGKAYELAIAHKRAEVRAIAANPETPTFANTIEALENSGPELVRMECLFRVFSQTMSTDDMREVEKRLAPLGPALADEIAHDDALFTRIDAVCQSGAGAGLSAEQQRLTAMIRNRMLRRGAGLAPEAKARLAEINGRIAELQSRFNGNLLVDQDNQAVFIEDEADLEGLSAAQRKAAAQEARERGREGAWAIPNKRPAVWPFLSRAARRDLREKVWRMWTMRGDNPGESDNKPVIAEILRLRIEKAQLLGFPSFTHLATADRMARTPEAGLDLLQRTWDRVIGPTRELVADLQAMADAEGGGFRIAPWDRLYYSEKLRQARFGLDAEAVKPYLVLDSVLQSMFWAAGRTFGLEFRELHDAPVCHPTVRVIEVSRAGDPIGVLWFDLFDRPEKMRGSWQQEYRNAESFRGRVLPLASVNSGLMPPRAGEPVLLGWEYANVFFHEFGHALHMICNESRYATLGSLGIEWDFIEVPALLNERWLYDRELLARFARRHDTGEPMPAALVEGIEQAARFDRIFSLNLDYLAPAIVDMRMYLLTDAANIDLVSFENQVQAELGMPDAWDVIMRVTHNWHSFSDSYPANLYVYLWADVIAADLAEAFFEAQGGLFDREVAERYRRTILSRGADVPAEQAFRDFRGRDPDPNALFRRFGLEPTE